jgi:hypothetical protein
MHGYSGSVFVDGTSGKYLQIHKFAYTTSQNKTLLASNSCSGLSFATSASLELSAFENTISCNLIQNNVLVASVSASDSTYNIPGVFGILGESTSSNYVYLDNISSAPHNSINIRITD